MSKILYASDLFYLSTICSARLVVLSFQYSLFGKVPQHAILIGCGAIGSALSMVMGVIMIGLGCHGIPSWLQCSEACESLVSDGCPRNDSRSNNAFDRTHVGMLSSLSALERNST